MTPDEMYTGNCDYQADCEPVPAGRSYEVLEGLLLLQRALQFPIFAGDHKLLNIVIRDEYTFVRERLEELGRSCVLTGNPGSGSSSHFCP